MDVSFGMNVPKGRNELIGEHQHYLERQFPAAIVEEILQVWAKELKCNNPEFAFVSMPVYSRDAGSARKFFVDIDFILEE